MKAKLLLAASLGLSPAVSLAQSTPHLYVGASALLASPTPFRSYNQNRFGPALTVGYQLSPRWAIQSGLGWTRQSNSFTNNYNTPSYPTDVIGFDSRLNQFFVPVLARYTFTDPASPLHVDALLGASWLHTTGRTSLTYAGATSPYTETYRGSNNDVLPSLGPSVRYTVGTHLDVVATSLLQVNLANGYGDFANRLSLNTQLGVQYSFGQ